MNKHYTTCSVIGEGRLNQISTGKEADFEIIEISASGVKIYTPANLDEKEHAALKMSFGGHFIAVSLKAEGQIVDKRQRGAVYEYNISFTNLPETKKIELDEIMKRTCNISTFGKSGREVG